MPSQEPAPSSGIKWNEVTWYSRFGAIILFLGVVPALSFYIGMQVQFVQNDNTIHQTTVFRTANLPIVAASTTATGGISTTTPTLTSDIPNDFSFDYQYGIYEINTRTGMLSEYQGTNASSSVVSFQLSKEDMDRVYREMLILGIFTDPLLKNVSLPSVMTPACYETLVVVANHRQNKLTWGCGFSNKTLESFEHFMNAMLTPIWQGKLPPYTGPMYE